MGQTMSLVRRAVAKMPEGQVFATKSLVSLGKRSTIDQIMRRLVDLEFVIRVARGVYRKTFGYSKAKTSWPSLEEIAHVKAEAFGKTIRSSGRELAQAFGIEQKPIKGIEFAASSSSSSFMTCRGRVIFKKVADSRLHLGNSVVGETLRAIWKTGESLLKDTGLAQRMVQWFGRKEKEEMRSRTALLPGWMITLLDLASREEKPQCKPGEKRPKRTSEYEPYLAKQTQLASALPTVDQHYRDFCDDLSKLVVREEEALPYEPSLPHKPSRTTRNLLKTNSRGRRMVLYFRQLARCATG